MIALTLDFAIFNFHWKAKNLDGGIILIQLEFTPKEEFGLMEPRANSKMAMVISRMGILLELA